jgi:alpha-mannosidase
MDERIIRMKLEQIRARTVRQRWPVRGWEARLAEHLAPGEYSYLGDWEPLPDGDSLWPAGKTLFLRGHAVAPDVPAEDLYLAFDADGLEGLLSVDGRPYAGVDPQHLRVVMPRTGPLDLSIECMCLGASLSHAELRREKARLREIAFVWVDRAVEAAGYDLWLAWEAAKFASDERRKALLEAALEEALLITDLTAPDETFRQQMDEARQRLAARVEAIAPDPEAGRIFLTGHTHIDTAWLWPLRETIRKCGRTFATACRLMERYPEFTFSCSQAQLYAYTQRHYPDLYAEIKKWVATGRWECTGAMWVESDCNVPSGEALIRQMLHGVRFFQQEFGRRPRTCWLPDVFGYPASMPQILKGCGVEQFLTNKLHWQARNPFPMHLFWWEGIDGTRLLAHIAKLHAYYNGWPNPEQLRFAWENYKQKAAYPEMLFTYGFGDGGGGVTEEMQEFARRVAAYPGLPATVQGPEEEYFARVRAAAPDLPRWVGELYLETHRGTYTTQSEAKRANRKSELLLRDTELLGVLANDAGAGLDLQPLRAAWENLLLLQFHDILPGSSIGEVYREAAQDYACLTATVTSVRDAALDALATRLAGAGQLLVCNTLSWERSDLVQATVSAADGPLVAVDGDGQSCPVQVVERRGDQADVVFCPAAVPPMGYATLTLRPAEGQPAESSLRVEPYRLENRFFLLELAEDGTIARLWDKGAEREVLAEGERGNVLHLYQDGPEREAAWNVHATFEKREYEWEPGVTVEVIERGPVRGGVRIVRRYRDSRIEQDLMLYDSVPRIDFVTRADWQARQVMLKAAFPVRVRSPRATFEIQFGAVERATHRNTSWEQEKFEVCAHRWADLSEAGYGVSLLNDSRYGYDVHDNVLRLTLLRGPEWPDPDADRGYHEFTYSLLPHLGDWVAGETVRRGWELNVPMLARAVAAGQASGAARAAFFQVSGPAILDTVKPAEDGNGWILRLYEPHGGRGTVQVQGPRAFARVTRTNLIEEGQEQLAANADRVTLPIGPFEIVTLRVNMA